MTESTSSGCFVTQHHVIGLMFFLFSIVCYVVQSSLLHVLSCHLLYSFSLTRPVVFCPLTSCHVSLVPSSYVLCMRCSVLLYPLLSCSVVPSSLVYTPLQSTSVHTSLVSSCPLLSYLLLSCPLPFTGLSLQCIIYVPVFHRLTIHTSRNQLISSF